MCGHFLESQAGWKGDAFAERKHFTRTKRWHKRQQVRRGIGNGRAQESLVPFVGKPHCEQREVLAFGEGVALPTRLRFKEVPAHQLPRTEAMATTTPTAHTGHDINFVSSVLERWRGAAAHREEPNDPTFNDQGGEPLPLRVPEAPMLQPSMGRDPDCFSLLKKPLR